MSATSSDGAPQAIRFTGTGGEYFRIWIVNLALTILTLGIYSARAKVRRLQYFYRNTAIAANSFDFHGSPKAILMGRLIGVGPLVLYNLAASFNVLVGLLAFLALVATAFVGAMIGAYAAGNETATDAPEKARMIGLFLAGEDDSRRISDHYATHPSTRERIEELAR